MTIHDVWDEDPATATPVWIAGAIVTAVSEDGCNAGQACQIFVQEDASYPSLIQGAQRAIKLSVDGFVNIGVGDVLNIYAHAVRATATDGELVLLVNAAHPGCARDVGNANPQPITGVALGDLTVNAYEDLLGPLYVRVESVTGTPGAADDGFAIQPTNGGSEGAVNLFPQCLPGGAFVGLSAESTDFESVEGVFGLYVSSTKFVAIYPRDMSDLQQ